MKTKILSILLFLSFSLSAQYTFEEFEINPNGDSKPHSFVEFNGELFFSASKNDSGIELWKTDGTESGTVLVKDINTGFGDGVITSFLPFKTLNNKLVFSAQQQGAGNTYLFESDGSNAGTKPISTDVQVQVNFYTEYNMVNYNNVILFPGTNKNGSSQGRELWKTDGVTTTIVKDINSGSSSSFPSEMTVFDNNVYFIANDGTFGSELWKTDGSDSGTSLVKDIKSGGSSSFNNYARFKVFKDKLYFSTNDGTHGREIWVTDGTEGGTNLFVDINPTSNQSGIIETDIQQQLFYVFEDKMYFKASNTYNASNITNNIEPWETDGTVSGTKQIADLNPTGNSMDDYCYFFNYNNRLLFTGRNSNDNVSGELWSYDLSNTPVNIMPSNVTFTNVGTDFYKPIVFNQALYINAEFNINNIDKGVELWKLTSNPLSLKRVKNDLSLRIYPNPTISNFIISSKNKAIQKIEIFNVLGKKVFEKSTVDKLKIAVSPNRLSKGMYLVKVYSENNLSSKKLIIN